MGIKNLMKLIKKYSPNSITYTNISKYKNKILGIDANLMIYKMVNAVRSNGYDIKNDNIDVTHLHTLLLKLLGFIKYDITPIFVFDGIPPKIKHETLTKRDNIKLEIQMKYDMATDENDKKKYYTRFDISSDEYDDCKELIGLFGYTCVDAFDEADTLLVELYNCGKIDYIVSDDMDILAFGGGIMLKNFTVSSNKKIQEINLGVMLNDMNIDRYMLVDMVVLMGCDYCDFYGIGPVKSYKYILKYKNVENIIKNENVEINKNYIDARNYFLNFDKMGCDINIGKLNCNIVLLEKFLNKYHFKIKYIEKIKTMIG